MYFCKKSAKTTPEMRTPPLIRTLQAVQRASPIEWGPVFFPTHFSQLSLSVVEWFKRCLDNGEETQVVITRQRSFHTEMKYVKAKIISYST